MFFLLLLSIRVLIEADVNWIKFCTDLNGVLADNIWMLFSNRENVHIGFLCLPDMDPVAHSRKNQTPAIVPLEKQDPKYRTSV